MGNRRRSHRNSGIADRLECYDLVFGEKEARDKLPAYLRGLSQGRIARMQGFPNNYY